jgi:hypothetical protein
MRDDLAWIGKGSEREDPRSLTEATMPRGEAMRRHAGSGYVQANTGIHSDNQSRVRTMHVLSYQLAAMWTWRSWLSEE